MTDRKHSSLLLASVAVFLLPVSTAFADTLTVCSSGCDYADIQSAIDDASDGDSDSDGAGGGSGEGGAGGGRPGRPDRGERPVRNR